MIKEKIKEELFDIWLSKGGHLVLLHKNENKDSGRKLLQADIERISEYINLEKDRLDIVDKNFLSRKFKEFNYRRIETMKSMESKIDFKKISVIELAKEN